MQHVYALPGWLLTKTVTETCTACIGSSAEKTLGCFLNMTLIFVVVHYMDGCSFTSEERKKNPQIDNSITICRHKMPAFSLA